MKQLDRGLELEFQDSWKTEIAAYELDKLLGLGMVPATVERSYARQERVDAILDRFEDVRS